MNVEEEHRYSSLVTSFFYVFEHPTPSTLNLRPGLDMLAGSLVRCAAHKIYVPYRKARFGPSIDETINDYPPSLQNRIEIVDRSGKQYNRVLRYLDPIKKEVAESPLILIYNHIEDFLYKVFLGAKYQAEADVSMTQFIGTSIKSLLESIRGAEAKFRLKQLDGIFSHYSKPIKFETFAVVPSASIPSIYLRISEFLDEAEIIQLQQQRYQLGLPGMAKKVLLRSKKIVNRILTKHKRWIAPATELIQIAETAAQIKIPRIDILKEIYTTGYNPPLVDLDYYRVQVCKEVSPGSSPNFMLPDGATRAMADTYFERRFR